MPLTPTPFTEVARRLRMDEDQVLAICEDLLRRGVIKRFGASISHRRLGFTANPMTVLKVPEERVDEVGNAIAREPGVTHCYTREGWEYNMFFMIHGKDREEAIQRAEGIVERVGGFEHRCIFSIRELKKVPFEITAPDVGTSDEGVSP